MAAYFIDSSALAKRHVSETGMHWVQALTAEGLGVDDPNTHRLEKASP